MCDFISWVEVGGDLFYLTDKEVFDGNAKKDFEGYRDNDFIGHGAIRKYFFLGDKGSNHEVRNFWETGTLPKELAEKLKSIEEFDKHWGKMFQHYFQNDGLCCIIRHAPDGWKEKAWRQLLKQNPSNYDLRYILRYTPDGWKSRAAEQLLKQDPSNHDLCCIIEYAPDRWKVKARKILKSRK